MSLSLCCISQRGNDETIDNNTTRCYRLRSGLFPVLPCLLNKHSASPVCCKVLKNLLQVQPTPPRSLILAVWVGTLGLSATLRSFKGLSRTRHGLNCDDDSNSRRRTNNTKASHLAGGRSSSLNVEVTAGGPTVSVFCQTQIANVSGAKLQACFSLRLPLIYYRHFYGHPCFPKALSLWG